MCGAFHLPCCTSCPCASEVSLIRISSVLSLHTDVSINRCHLHETFSSVVFGEEVKRGNICAQRSLVKVGKEKKGKRKKLSP